MNPSSPQVSVVIPNFRRKESVVTLVGELGRQRDADFEIIIVDDCSNDGSVDAIRQVCPHVTVIASEKNGGPSVARNKGIRQARGPILVGLDSDVSLVDPHVIAKTVDTFDRHPAVDGLAYRIYRPDGVTDDGPRWCHPRPMAQYAASYFETEYFSGTGYAFRTASVLRAGLFPEYFFMDYEEVELAYRVLDHGGTILYTPAISVLHMEHVVSRRGQADTYFRPRNQILFAITALPTLRALGFLATRVPFQGLKSIRGGYVANYLRAMRDGMRMAPARWRARNPLKVATMRRIMRIRRSRTLFTPTT
ncbi:MAG: glycosyltransferase family 2 protein [Opitutaceae bacterium]|nr:glycosyltransferase family 2 protein [Opitutaceae bacterium]